MNINIELEIKAKLIETFKTVLKNTTTVIEFVGEIDIEYVIVRNKQHVFKIEQTEFIKHINIINPKYLKLIPKKILNDESLKNKQKILLVSNIRYLKLFKYFLGDLILPIQKNKARCTITYNDIVYSLTKSEYEKYYYYAEYAYKITQLKLLNNELGIKQNISIYFDENILSNSMYNKMHSIIKKIL